MDIHYVRRWKEGDSEAYTMADGASACGSAEGTVNVKTNFTIPQTEQ